MEPNTKSVEIVNDDEAHSICIRHSSGGRLSGQGNRHGYCFGPEGHGCEFEGWSGEDSSPGRA
mgnify:CR=1 FL=1